MHEELFLHHLADRRHMSTMEYMHHLVNKLGPDSISAMFKMVSEATIGTTRAATNLWYSPTPCQPCSDFKDRVNWQVCVGLW